MVETEKQYQAQYYIKNKTRLKKYRSWHYAQNRDKYVETSRLWRVKKKAEKLKKEVK